MPSSATKAKPVHRRIGRVINGYSNYLAVLVADLRVAAAYSGPVNEPVEEDGRKKKQKPPSPDDFDRACKAVNKKEYALGNGKGVVVEIGGCGVAEVLRLGDALVIPETCADEDDVDLEAERDRVIASHPTTKPKLIGTVDVKSGVLVMMGLFEPGPELDAARVAKLGVVKTLWVSAGPKGRRSASRPTRCSGRIRRATLRSLVLVVNRWSMRPLTTRPTSLRRR